MIHEDIDLLRKSQLFGKNQEDFDNLTGKNRTTLDRVGAGTARDSTIQDILEKFEEHDYTREEITEYAQMIRDGRELKRLINKATAVGEQFSSLEWLSVIIGYKSYCFNNEEIEISFNELKARKNQNNKRFCYMLSYYYLLESGIDVYSPTFAWNHAFQRVADDLSPILHIDNEEVLFTLQLFIGGVDLESCLPLLSLCNIISSIWLTYLFGTFENGNFTQSELYSRRFWETEHGKYRLISEPRVYGRDIIVLLFIFNLDDFNITYLGEMAFCGKNRIYFSSYDFIQEVPVFLRDIGCAVSQEIGREYLTLEFDDKIDCGKICLSSKWKALPDSLKLREFKKYVTDEILDNCIKSWNEEILNEENALVQESIKVIITDNTYNIVLRTGEEFEFTYIEYPWLWNMKSSNHPLVMYNKEKSCGFAQWVPTVHTIILDERNQKK